MNYLYAILGAILLLAGDAALFYHLGGNGVKLTDEKAVIKQETKDDAKRVVDQSTVAQEAKTYETATDPALDPIAAPDVRVCHYTATIVPSANPAGSRVDASPSVRAPDPSNAVPSIDIGRPLVQISHNADAQIAGLQDYIEHVCQVQH